MQYNTHYISHIESIDIPFYSLFLSIKYANSYDKEVPEANCINPQKK